MSYSLIEKRLTEGKTIILDGGIGGELQKIGAKMDKGLWCGRCSIDSPDELLKVHENYICLLYTSPSPRDRVLSRMPSSA